jgi:hypothetical protein
LFPPFKDVQKKSMSIKRGEQRGSIYSLDRPFSGIAGYYIANPKYSPWPGALQLRAYTVLLRCRR